MADIIAWHGKSLSEHVALRDKAAKEGYRFLSLGIYGSTNSPVYCAVMIKRPHIVAQRDFPALTASQWQETFDDQAKKGYGPVMITATGSGADPLFAAVFQPQNPIPLTRHGLTSGSDSDLSTIQGMNKKAKADGLILHWAASYGDAGSPAYAAIWMPDPSKIHWNADGVLDSSSDYQARFNAETSGWCRPAFVTLDKDDRYMSVFVDNQIGPWVARHNMSPDEYQHEFDKQTKAGFFPFCAQAAGTSKTSAKFAALFAKSEDVVPKHWHANGPVANAAIDAVIQQAMKDSPVRDASLAIVHGTKLVYARAYTLAEPGWPQVQPATCFRIASVSKTVASLGIYQLIEAGTLQLGYKLQDILHLKTPSGGAPKDPRFSKITIRHLLEHTSGVDAGAFNDDISIQNAFIAAGKPATLPINAAQVDSYVAGLNLVTDPGATQVYNNCGYYLLARVVAKLWNKSEPIDALKTHLFDPLSIHRIRRARSLIVDQPADEARYQQPDLNVLQSVMTPGRPLVPQEYGNEQLENKEGSGGLTAATVDLARLIAIFIKQGDNPALKRSTLTSMLSAGAAVSAAGMGRAGYGFDYLQDLGGGKYYGQKGGSLSSSNDVLEFNGDWGFAMCWGAPPFAAGNWYPDFPAVMNIAKAANWGNADLFPQFGMPSL